MTRDYDMLALDEPCPICGQGSVDRYSITDDGVAPLYVCARCSQRLPRVYHVCSVRDDLHHVVLRLGTRLVLAIVYGCGLTLDDDKPSCRIELDDMIRYTLECDSREPAAVALKTWLYGADYSNR